MNQKRIIYTAVLVGMAIWLVFEYRVLHEQGQEIAALRQQMTELVAGNERMTNLVAQARQLQTQQTGEQVKELVQLRNEMRVLRQQTNDVEALRGEVSQIRTAVEAGGKAQSVGQTSAANSETAPNTGRLEILEASYWTENKTIDVTEQIRKRIAGDKLEVIAGNDIRGDPENGQVKTLSVLYRFDGVAGTNEVREGGLMLIPPE
jgi:hypothetical protein